MASQKKDLFLLQPNTHTVKRYQVYQYGTKGGHIDLDLWPRPQADLKPGAGWCSRNSCVIRIRSFNLTTAGALRLTAPRCFNPAAPHMSPFWSPLVIQPDGLTESGACPSQVKHQRRTPKALTWVSDRTV